MISTDSRVTVVDVLDCFSDAVLTENGSLVVLIVYHEFRHDSLCDLDVQVYERYLTFFQGQHLA